MLAPTNMKAFYPLFSDIAVDAVEYLKGLRDENSIVNDVREEVIGKWALECKYAITVFIHWLFTNTRVTVFMKIAAISSCDYYLDVKSNFESCTKG